MDHSTVFLRLLLAVVLGGVIGLERERGFKPAGLRTHMLVSLGCALFMLVAMESRRIFGDPNGNLDPSRIAAQILTGVGFLGAGTILQARGSIHGLTTAASIWTVAAIGVAVAGGYYYGAVATTAFGVGVLWLVEKVEQLFGYGGKIVKLRVELGAAERLRELQEALRRHTSAIQRVESEPGPGWVAYTVEVLMDRRRLPLLTAEIRLVPDVRDVHVD